MLLSRGVDDQSQGELERLAVPLLMEKVHSHTFI